MERQPGHQTLINNRFYDDLEESWYTATNHPIALLRAENAVRGPWVSREIAKRFKPSARILDIGCGAGLLTNPLATEGYNVTGIDLSKSSLEVARKFDASNKVLYLCANAYDLPFLPESFDVVCATDLLEHVENPLKVIQQASRVLRSGGIFFFHTFNRTLLSYLLIIKGAEWFVKNTPPNLHVYELFIKPEEMKTMCHGVNLEIDHLVGFAPQIWQKAFWKMLVTREVPKDFNFIFTKNTSTGYCGMAVKH